MLRQPPARTEYITVNHAACRQAKRAFALEPAEIEFQPERFIVDEIRRIDGQRDCHALGVLADLAVDVAKGRTEQGCRIGGRQIARGVGGDHLQRAGLRCRAGCARQASQRIGIVDVTEGDSTVVRGLRPPVRLRPN